MHGNTSSSSSSPNANNKGSLGLLTSMAKSPLARGLHAGVGSPLGKAGSPLNKAAESVKKVAKVKKSEGARCQIFCNDETRK